MKRKSSIVKFCRCPQCRPAARFAVKTGHKTFRRLTKQALRKDEEPPKKISLGYLD